MAYDTENQAATPDTHPPAIAPQEVVRDWKRSQTKRSLLARIVKNRAAYLWMSLAVAIVTFSTVYPMVFAADYSMWATRRFTKVRFVGLDNYVQLASDARFWASVGRSVYFTFGGVLITTVVGFVLAMLLRKSSRTNSLYRTVILVPWVTNEIAFALMWVWVLNPQMSPLYYVTNTLLNLQVPNLLNSTQFALATLTVINGLRAVGFALVMMLAAITTIPNEVEQAAEVDGCYGLRSVWHIYLPLVRPVMRIVVIVLTISYFNIIGMILFTTGGGPVGSTEILSLRLYREGFTYLNIATASTLTALVLMINLGFAGVYHHFIKAESIY